MMDEKTSIGIKGLVTDIQRFSLKDGPGIRTTVFFQGCNMKCAWCHNPETIARLPQLLYYEENCIRCGQCIAACPWGALKAEGKRVRVDRKLCRRCGKCQEQCFAKALVFSSREMDAGEVMEEILQDKEYYRNSGGGVTLSGGEVLRQPDFAMEILKRCRNEKIATAIETNMYSEWCMMEKVIPLLDLIMCDIKTMDREKHKSWTGTDNGPVLENIRRLSEYDIPVIVRTPVIPGVNDTAAETGAAASWLKEAVPNLLYYELLRFNPLGEAKYRGLDMENMFAGVKIPADEEMECLADAAAGHGIRVRIG